MSGKTAAAKERRQGPDLPCQNLRTEGSWRNYVMRHACLATWPDRTIWAGFYYGFVTDKHINVMFVTRLGGQEIILSRIPHPGTMIAEGLSFGTARPFRLTGAWRYKLLNLPYYYPMRRFFCLPVVAAI